MKYNPMSQGFHTHTMYGSLDSPASANDLIERSVELGRNALTVTDHGYMNALPEIWRINEGLKKKGKPAVQIIHGIEPYITFENLPEIEKLKNYFHMTILFKSEDAFRWFSRYSLAADKRASTVWGEKKPKYCFEWFKEIAGDIVVGSGCMQGVIQQLFLKERPDLAEEYYLYIRDIFGKENFFVELMPHKLDKDWISPEFVKNKIVKDGYFKQRECDLQAAPNRFLYELAKKHNDKMVISEDAHFAWREQKVIQDILLGNGKQKWRFSETYSMESTDFWSENLIAQTGCTEDDIHQMVENSYQVSKLCEDYKFRTSSDKIYLPNMKMIFNEDKPTLQTLIEEIKANGLMPTDPEKLKIYKERLQLEIDVLVNNGVADFIPYIMLVYDVVRHFRKKKGYITPRGSAGGSLILFLLGISIADPIKYNLSFARFLTKGRILEGNFPDIDLDCADQKSVFNFLEEKYKDRFCQVCTDSVMKLKTSMKDVDRVYNGSVSIMTNAVSVALPNTPQGMDDDEFVFGYEKDGVHFDGIIDENEDYSVNLRQWIEDNPQLWEATRKCLGTIKTHGVHACACLITPEPIADIVPLSMAKNGALICQYTHPRSEYIGAVKYDFLSLDTLKSIGLAYQKIEETTGKTLAWEEVPEEKEVFDSIVAGNKLAGIFQMSANALRPYVVRMPPKNIVEISNILALVRPGALDAPSPRPNAPKGETASLFYVNCVNGKTQPYFVHEDLRPIVEETYSVILYQEQIMRIFTDLADYEEGEAASAMKAVSKKKKEALEKHCGNLREGCRKRGWTEEQIDYLIDSVMASARYSFNKSHSLSYAINAYIECWLKYHYPLQFWAAKLSVISHKGEKQKGKKDSDDTNKFTPLMVEAKKYVGNLNLRRCDLSEWIIDGDKLLPPLLIIKGVGPAVAQKIVKFARSVEWHSFDNFVDKLLEKKKEEKTLEKQDRSTEGIKITDIVTLLFHGVFDEYIEGDKDVKKYSEILDGLRVKFKNKKSCSKFDEIKTDIELIRFRMKNNPIFTIDTEKLKKKYKSRFEELGYVDTNHDVLIFQKGNTDVFLDFNTIEKPSLMGRYENGFNLELLCLVKSVKEFLTKAGKPFLKVFVDVGGTEHALTLFSDYNTGRIPDHISQIVRPNTMCVIGVKPGMFRGEISGIIKTAFWIG